MKCPTSDTIKRYFRDEDAFSDPTWSSIQLIDHFINCGVCSNIASWYEEYYSISEADISLDNYFNLQEKWDMFPLRERIKAILQAPWVMLNKQNKMKKIGQEIHKSLGICINLLTNIHANTIYAATSFVNQLDIMPVQAVGVAAPDSDIIMFKERQDRIAGLLTEDCLEEAENAIDQLSTLDFDKKSVIKAKLNNKNDELGVMIQIDVVAGYGWIKSYDLKLDKVLLIPLNDDYEIQEYELIRIQNPSSGSRELPYNYTLLSDLKIKGVCQICLIQSNEQNQ